MLRQGLKLMNQQVAVSGLKIPGVMKMSLTTEKVEQIAYLARLALDAKAVPEYAENLSSILALVEQMDTVNTDNVEPLAHPLELTQRLRADVVTEQDHRDDYQQSAPATEAGLYLVPQVID